MSADGAGQRRDQDAAGLGLPPGVDDRAAPVADHAVVPQPGFGIDRLADRAEQAQALACRLLHRRLALAHQGADRGGRRVEDVDLMLVDHLPEAAGVGIVGHALEHQGRGAVGERSIDDVAVAGDPAHVGGAPVDVAVVIIEHVLVRHRGEDDVAAGRVQHALGFTRRTRGVEDEERILGIHRLGRALGRHLGGDLVPPDVAAGIPADLAAGVLYHQHLLHARAFRQRFVGVGLERHRLAATQAFVGGDDDVALAVDDTVGEAVGREAAEHDRMDGADARAGEHGVGRFGDHRQVDRDPIALLDAEFLQRVGHAAHFGVQLAIGDLLRLRRIVAFPDDRGLVGALGEMAIDAVGRHVQHAIVVPADTDVAGIVDIAHGAGAVRLDPVDTLAVLAPESSGILDRRFVHRLVLRFVDIGALGPIGADGDHLIGHGFPPVSLGLSRELPAF